ncbi:MAG: ribosome-associated protein [Flavobacteriales bacterium]|jgi:ribosome-associated protein
MEYKLNGQPYIQLNNILKILGLVGTGGEAKMRILDGEAFLNEEVCTIIRKKLVVGDKVIFDVAEITVVE